ncbi:MAG: transposase, partial [Cyanobacteria bacterium P01_F01_bin.33]
VLAPAMFILDNAAFYREEVIESLAKEYEHQVMFLPPYLPDLNKIEHDLAALKKRMAYAPSNLLTDQVKQVST